MDQFIRGFKHFFEVLLSWVTPDIDWYGVGVTFGFMAFVILFGIGVGLLTWCISKVFKDADDT